MFTKCVERNSNKGYSRSKNRHEFIFVLYNIGRSNWKNQWIEIYNQSASSVNVSGWNVIDSSGSVPIPSVSPIPAHGFAVITGNQSTTTIPSSALTITLGSNKIGSNGLDGSGDFVKLLNGSTTVDQMSYGTNVTVFSSPPTAPTSTTSLARHPNGVNTDTTGDWHTNVALSVGATNP